MNGSSGFRFTPRLVWGLCLLLLGVIFTLDNLHLVQAGKVLRYWPAILIVIGLAKLLRPRGGRTVGILLLLIGSFLLLRQLDFISYRWRDLWPLLLILLGASMLWRAVVGKSLANPNTFSGSHLSSFALMSGVERKVITKDFRGGEVSAIMGGCEIDLRQADIAGPEAVIDVFAFWGGIGLIVPEQWAVVGKVVPVMGGFEDNSRAAASEAGAHLKQLVVKGLAVMGGVEVRNSKKD